MTTVFALGGNALVQRGERGTAAEQRANIERTCAAVVAELDGPAVFTHGNGPQVGQMLLRHERAADEVPPHPLWLAVAETQAEIGALLALELRRATGSPAACIVTHVLVDPDDPAFAEPTKPIGPFYDEAQATQLRAERAWNLVHEATRGWRRVVPSPEPREIVELNAICTLVQGGTHVVACGGGGVPVARRERGLAGIEAVIDKDRASALVGIALRARRLVILTDVPAVAERFGTPDAADVPHLSVDEAVDLAALLPAGSMRPKLEAAARFVRETGGEALITSAEALADARAGRAGTRVVK